MYYDNKLGFYIKQYGTQIVAVVVCLIIIASGLFLYFKINSKNNNSVDVASQSKENKTENVTVEDDSILSEELQNLNAGQKATVKIATIDDNGVMVIISGNKRINAKLLGVEFSNELPDTLYLVDKDLSGKDVEISFDEKKVVDGYAMVYVYTDNDTLYNAKLLKEGKLSIDSSIDKKALEYNTLAESQAYAKQTSAGIWNSENN